LARIRQPIFGSKSNFLPLFRKAERQKRASLIFCLLVFIIFVIILVYRIIAEQFNVSKLWKIIKKIN